MDMAVEANSCLTARSRASRRVLSLLIGSMLGTTALLGHLAATTAAGAAATTSTRRVSCGLRGSSPYASGVTAIVSSTCVVIDATSADLASGWDLPPRQVYRYGPQKYQRLHVYRTASPVSKGTIVFVHGGAWLFGKNTRTSVHPAIVRQQKNGWDVVSVSYVSASREPVPAAVYDIKRAVRYVRLNAVALDVDARKVVLAGHSAGAHLATLAALTPGVYEPVPGASTRVDAVIDIAGPSWLPTWSTREDIDLFEYTPAALSNLAFGCDVVDPYGGLDCSEELLAELSPAFHLNVGDPPAFLAYAQSDPVVPIEQGVLLYREWRLVQPAVWLDMADGSRHAVEGVNARALGVFLDEVVG